MKNCVPPRVKSCSKNGELPNTNPDRVEKPSTNFTGDVAGLPSGPIGAQKCPSTSTRWKVPDPPSRPPLCDSPSWTMVPAVGNGRSIRVSRINDAPTVERTQSLQRKALENARLVEEPVKLC